MVISYLIFEFDQKHEESFLFISPCFVKIVVRLDNQFKEQIVFI